MLPYLNKKIICEIDYIYATTKRGYSDFICLQNPWNQKTQKASIHTTDNADQLSAMEEKDKNDTEESDLDDYLDDDSLSRIWKNFVK